jgi:AraC-like DNA-binding protein
MDALAEILSTSRIAGSVICRSFLQSPWGISLDEEKDSGIFHFVMGGLCWLQMPDDGRSVRLVQGDVVLLPQGAAHVLTDTLGHRPVPLAELLTDCDPGPTLELRLGGDGPQTALLSGAYRFDPAESHPVFAHLPPVIHVPAAFTEASNGTQTALRLLATELSEQRSGYQAVVDRLVDMVFIYIVRSWLESQPEGSRGWLAALRQPQIAEALCLLHRHPTRRWTIESLARAVGMSRSSFAREFKELTGEPPLAYLTGQRIDKAAHLLQRSALPLAQIAERIGYDSEYSFSKAFKRTKGISPGKYRTLRRSA